MTETQQALLHPYDHLGYWVCDQLEGVWNALKPLDAEHRYITVPVKAQWGSKLYRDGYVSWQSVIALCPAIWRVDGHVLLVMRHYAADPDRRAYAFLVGPWVRPELRGDGIAHRLNTAAFTVAAMYEQDRIIRNTGALGGTWWEHYWWSKIADGDLALPDGWQYVAGPSDALIDRPGLVDESGPNWPAEHLIGQPAEFGYAQRLETPCSET